MSIRLHSTAIRMRPPGGDWHTIATSLAGDAAVAVGEVIISWGQPTPRDHPEPGTIGFTLLVPDDALDEAVLSYDTEVRIEAFLERWSGDWSVWPAAQTLARGWLTRWTRDTRRRLDGRRTYRISCIDVLGRAAATRLAATPWPSTQTMQQRVAAINSASAAGPLLAPDGSSVTVQPYDVDNAPALDVIHRHTELADVTVESDAGITIARRPNRAAYYADAEIYFPWYANLRRLVVQADMIEDLGRELDRSSVVSEVGITAYWGDETERREITYRDTTAGYSSSRYSVDTDERIGVSSVTGVDGRPVVEAWARRLIAESITPRRRLPAGHRLRLGLARYNPDLWNLFIMYERGRGQILDIEDAPADLDRLQYVQGGTLTITGHRIRLTLDTAPAGLFGVRPMRFSDLPRDARRPRIRGTARTSPPGDAWTVRKTRISDTSAVSIAAWPTPNDPEDPHA